LAIAASRAVEFAAMPLLSPRHDQACRKKMLGFTSLKRKPAALLILLSTAAVFEKRPSPLPSIDNINARTVS
jgi:hypothetical protein